jgi:hypothetical protein
MTKAWVDKDHKALMAESEVLDTPMGRIVSTMLKADVKLGASTRGGGNTVAKEGKNFVSEKGYKWGGFDFVFEPSAQNAYPKPVREQIEKIILESSPDSFNEAPDYFKAVLEKLGCNGNLILERVKQPKSNLNEVSNKNAIDEATEGKLFFSSKDYTEDSMKSALAILQKKIGKDMTVDVTKTMDDFIRVVGDSDILKEIKKNLGGLLWVGGKLVESVESNSLALDEAKKEVEALRKKVKSLEEAAVIKESDLSSSTAQI